MKFTIKTEDFSAKFVVYDNEDLERYLVKNEMDAVMRKLTIFDLADNVVCTVEKKFFTLRPTYVIHNRHNELVANIRKKLNLLHPQFTITSELDEIKFHTTGDYFGEVFSITTKDEKDIIATITRKSGYTIDIIDDEHDAPAIIAVVIIIHLCCHLTKDE
ncbi:unnamed protein product [Adineta steineri]|uniref:Uncharacterized protein n=1 Tax=Adineta steineri TaxID=433720 RepID=A0A813SM25_9BILA|nr:unnamed protein product [Adineta steineri]CAF0793641.1 unnamed protein product [Adineta steineri]CAF0797860.1 unnamed protein product [Adineta steineri]CAF0803886.1 unnamed protein product [Adineta steineri]CAF0881561.1 unnamed protein product [Adineta steineri]